jgi:hypothetical protein
MKLINASIYWNERGRIPNSLHRLLQDVPGCALAIILIIYPSKVKIFPLLEELPKNIIPNLYNRIKVCTEI